VRRIAEEVRVRGTLPKVPGTSEPDLYLQDIRDVVIHEYASIDLGIVWNVVESKLPDLKLQLQRLRDDTSDL